MSEIIIGIDLGTTNSEVAIVENGKVTVIADGENRTMLPSFVGIGEGGEILVGEPARNQYVLYPERTIKSIKRRMGEPIQVEMAGKHYSPQEISAIILKRLKSVAEEYIKKPIQKAVITVPAYFSDAQRQATREAGEIAGLDVVRIINEPTAAALAYEVKHEVHKHILVYDLGGGTFDVSVVGIEDDVVEVLASHGNNKLGGDDFDAKITQHIVRHIHDQHGIDLTESRQVMARINRAAEGAKRALSDQPFVRIDEEYLFEKEGAPIHLSLELSRYEYESMIAEYIDETLEAVHIALSGANLVASDIDEILLVGGSTRTPVISERLFDEFGLEPQRNIDPDLCVAMGAAIQAGMIAGESVSAVLVDVTPYTYGTSVIGELHGEYYSFKYVPVIRKNTPLPTSKTEAFYTASDGQQEVLVHVYQGEDEDALNNIEIGEFKVKGLRNVPAGNTVTMTFDLDLNGILHISAREKETGLEKSITIGNAIARFQEEEMEQAKARVNALFGTDLVGEYTKEEKGAKEEHHTQVKAHALVEKAQKLLDKAADEDKEDIIDLIEQINDGLAGKHFDVVEEAVEKLADILYYLEN
ncbi:MAG: Hsp70 family protein [Methylococcaceae bacterium]|nr:Hsp70 family protein [Methylococcaceae bacterium]